MKKQKPSIQKWAKSVCVFKAFGLGRGGERKEWERGEKEEKKAKRRGEGRRGKGRQTEL